MRTRAISYCALLAGLAAAPSAASAAARCENVVAGEHAFVGPGENCTAPAGDYVPFATGTTILPFNDPGFGFVSYGGGQLDTEGAVTITTGETAAVLPAVRPFATGDGAFAVLSRGAGSLVTLTNGATLTTLGDGASGVEADTGGHVVIGAVGVTSTIATSGQGSDSLFATGANSQIDATNVTTNIATDISNPVFADQNATINFVGGSIGTTGRFAINVFADHSSTVTLSGTTLAATGNGSNPIAVMNLATVVGDNLTITTSGGLDQSTGVAANGVYTASGGTARISNSSISISGAVSSGVWTDSGGVAVLNNDTIVVSNAAGGAGVVTAGGNTTITGGSATVASANTVVISAQSGGVVTASGMSITATGAGAAGVGVSGANSSFTGSNLTILVQGDYDPATGYHPNGVTNQSFGPDPSAGTVKLINSTITLTGNGGEGLYNGNGGSATIKGGSISTSGALSDGVYAAGASATNLDNLKIATTGAGAKGISVTSAGTTLSGTGLTISTADAIDPTTGYHAEALYNGAGGGAATTGGGTVFLTNSTLVTGGANAQGVSSENGGATSIAGGSIKTTGVLADAVYGASGSSTSLSGVTLTTTGNASKGIDIEGAATTLVGSNLTISTSGSIDPTTGFHAQGVYNGSSVPPSAGATGGGKISLTDSAVVTSGANAYGVDTANAGATTFAGGSISTSGAGSTGLLTTTGGLTTVTADISGHTTTIATSGASAPGAFAASGGIVSLAGLAITTTGDGSVGLLVHDQGSSVQATNVTINTQGSADGVYNGPGTTGTSTSGGSLTLTNASVITSGDNAAGAIADTGGVTKIAGGSFVTSGIVASAVGVLNAGNLGITDAVLTTTGNGSAGLVVNGAGGQLTASNLTISTSGGIDAPSQSHADGVFNGAFGNYASGGVMTVANSSVKTSGFQSYGVSGAAGSTTSFLGGSIATTGDGAIAIRVRDGGALTVGLDNAGVGTTATTSGLSAIGATAFNGGSLTLNGTQITTTGDGSIGLAVNDAGTTVVANNVTIVTKGGYDVSSGLQAYGVFNGAGAGGVSGGTLTLTNANVTTSGMQSDAVRTTAGGATNIAGGAFSTSGQDAWAVGVVDSGKLQIANATLTSTGVASEGLVLAGMGGSVVASNLTINETGAPPADLSAQPVAVFNGANAQEAGNGQMSLTDSTVRATGLQAVGLFTGSSATTTVLGGSIATTGANSVAVASQDAGQTILGLNAQGHGAAISTSGDSSDAVIAFAGGSASLTNAAVTTTGDGSTGLAVYYAGSSLTATDTTVAVNGGLSSATNKQAYGVYNGPGFGGTVGGTLALNDVSVTTAGAGAIGVLTTTGGTATIAGGSVATAGANAAAVAVNDTGALTISGAALTTTADGSPGITLSGASATASASNLTISTAGGASADGAYNGPQGAFTAGGTMSITDSTVKTSGAQAYGVAVGAGGTTTFLGGSITTTGAGANAARADNGGSLTIGLDATGHGAALATSGAAAYAVNAAGGSLISVTGAAIATTGNGSGGLLAATANDEIDAANVTISTQGGVDSASGLGAYGALNGLSNGSTVGGTLKLNDVAISTAGDNMHGVYTGAGATTTFNGGSVATTGAAAYGLYATGAGASLTASGVAITTQGAGAYGAAADSGGTLTLANTQISTTGANAHGLYLSVAVANLTGPISINVGGVGAAGIFASLGGSVFVKGALTINAAANGIYLNGAAAVERGLGAVELSSSGALNVKTTSATGAALTLSGTAAFSGTGGGTIDATGTAIALLSGAQTASFTNYNISNARGGLIYADPSTSTVTFDHSTVDSQAGVLADVVNGSDLTLDATASSLMGAIVTDVGSTSNVNLSGGSVWTLAGSSTVTNLSLNNSSAMFAPSTGGGFNTLTVNNYTGTNGGLTLNAALGGANPGADQLVVNGGKATGATTINVRSISSVGAATTGLGVPLVVATNGGSVAPNAFSLSGPLVVGSYTYTLQNESGGDYLVSGQGLSSSQASGSLASLAQSRQSQAVTSRVLGSILTGATEQINCSSCSSGFASFGSFAIGLHGRWTLSPNVSLLAGASYDNYSAKGVTVNNSLIAALALRYDAVQLGKYRPFFEAGVASSPWANVSYRRSYQSTVGGGQGDGDTLSRSVAVYGRAGYIWRLGPTDEAAAYSDLTRSWQSTGGYLEGATGGNPFGALVLPSLDTMDIWQVGAQYTHLFGEHIEANVSAGYAVAFDASYGNTAAIAGFGDASGAAPTHFDWVELGGRISYRFSKNVIGDAFVLGTVGAEPAGSQIHGGVAIRMAF